MRNLRAANPTFVGWKPEGREVSWPVHVRRAVARGGRSGLIHTLSHPHDSFSAVPEQNCAGPIGVMLVIASRLERLGWSIVLERQQDIRLQGQFARCREAFSLLELHPPDVALVDETMLTEKDCAALRRYAARTATRFLLVAPHPVDQPLAGSRYAFASECLLKGLTAEELLAAIRRPGVSAIAPAAAGSLPAPKNHERSHRR